MKERNESWLNYDETAALEKIMLAVWGYPGCVSGAWMVPISRELYVYIRRGPLWITGFHPSAPKPWTVNLLQPPDAEISICGRGRVVNGVGDLPKVLGKTVDVTGQSGSWMPLLRLELMAMNEEIEAFHERRRDQKRREEEQLEAARSRLSEEFRAATVGG